MYQKDKYKFSSNTSLVLMGKDVTEQRGQQAIQFNKELAEYGIVISDLIAVNYEESVRNEILNIAIYLSKNAELFKEMEDTKRLPISNLTKHVMRTKKCLEGWKDYIIAYSLIIGSFKYKYLNEYLRVIENVEEEKNDNKVIHLKEIINIGNENEIKEYSEHEDEDEIEEEQIKGKPKNFKGIIVSKNKKKAIILTSNGIFKKVSVEKETVCGEEVTGKAKKTLRDFKKAIIALFAIVICVILGATYFYTNVVSTVVIELGSSVRLEINSLNRVVNASSISDEGDEIINNTNIKDKNIDSAIYRIIKYSLDNKKITPHSTVNITVSGEAIKYGVLEETTKYVDQEKIEVKFNNAGYQKKFN